MLIPVIIMNIDVADVNADVLLVCGMYCMSAHLRERDSLALLQGSSFFL